MTQPPSPEAPIAAVDHAPALPLAMPPLRSFHVMTKPIGPICNLGCTYCFYLEKEGFYPGNHRWKMSDEVLESYIRQYIEAQEVPEISFAWQGGEPTLLGVAYFHRVVELQRRYANGKRIINAFQTNGTLLDEDWCRFFRQNDFLVGISIDGPRKLHDAFRVDKKGEPTFDRVMAGIDLLKKFKVEFNTLTVVQRRNSRRPLEVYEFLREIGSGFIQFIPLIERVADGPLPLLNARLDFAPPPDPAVPGPREPDVSRETVKPEDYGEFLCTIFDTWVRRDVGTVFVQMFDVALGNWLGTPPGLCLFSPKCGAAMAIEHNGDLYACDHFVYPKFHLGNIMNRSLGEMAGSLPQRQFGEAKQSTLPAYCRSCEVRFACHGECPKHRFTYTPDGEWGLNYLCPAYKRFFNHVDPYMKTMAELIRRQRPPADIMPMLARQEPQAPAPARNAACPCGSNKKYKHCCGRSR